MTEHENYVWCCVFTSLVWVIICVIVSLNACIATQSYYEKLGAAHNYGFYTQKNNNIKFQWNYELEPEKPATP